MQSTVPYVASGVAKAVAPSHRPRVLAALLGAGLLFHASTAVLMGLSGFFFACVATYPALPYLNQQVRLGLF